AGWRWRPQASRLGRRRQKCFRAWLNPDADRSIAQRHHHLLSNLFDQGGEAAVHRQRDGGADGLGVGRGMNGRTGRLAGQFGGFRLGERIGEKAAGEVRLIDQRADDLEHGGGFERFLEDGVATGAAGLLLVHRLEQAGDEDDTGMLVAIAGLDAAAQLVARNVGQENVGQDDVGILLVNARQGIVARGGGDNVKALFAQDAFAHPLSVGAVVGEENEAVHPEIPVTVWADSVAAGPEAGARAAGPLAEPAPSTRKAGSASVFSVWTVFGSCAERVWAAWASWKIWRSWRRPGRVPRRWPGGGPRRWPGPWPWPQRRP